MLNPEQYKEIQDKETRQQPFELYVEKKLDEIKTKTEENKTEINKNFSHIDNLQKASEELLGAVKELSKIRETSQNKKPFWKRFFNFTK